MPVVITNNFNSSHVEKKQPKKSKVNKVSGLKPKQNSFISVLLNGLHSATRFILNNPGKTLALGLAGQVVGSGALSNLQNQSSMNNNLTDPFFLNKSHFNNSLVFAEKRTVPVFIATKSDLGKVINFKRSRKPRQSGVGPQQPEENTNSVIMNSLRWIQDKLNDLKNRMDRVNSSTVSLAEVLSVKNDAEARMTALTTRLDNIKSDLSQEYAVQINAINQIIQGLQFQLTLINTALLQKIADIERKISKQDEEIKKQREANRHATKERAIQDCIAAIRDGQIEQAKTKWGYIIELDTNKYWFKEEIERIIRDVYSSSLSYFDKIDNFIRNGLPLITQSAVGYKTLMEEMKQNNQFFTPEMIRVGYRLKEYMGMTDYPNINQEYKNIYESLKSELPNGVKNLLWNTVCIRNSEHNENLFADYDRSYDSERRYVFTWRPGNVVGDAYWKFIPENDAKSFVIKNIRYGEYLYAAGDSYAYDSQRRHIFTWKSGSAVTSGRWVVEPLNQWSFKIKLSPDNSIGKTEYLYATGDSHAYDSERRRVFAWRPGNPVSNGYWYIDDCTTNRRRRSLLDRDVENLNSQSFTELFNKIFATRHGEHEVRNRGAHDGRTLTGETGNASRRQVMVVANAQHGPKWVSAWRMQDESGPSINRVIQTNLGNTTAKIFREHSNSLAKKDVSLSEQGVIAGIDTKNNVSLTMTNSPVTDGEKKLSLSDNFKDKLLFFRTKQFQIPLPTNETLVSNSVGVENNHAITPHKEKMNTTL
ncbi:MAG: hypothetical protein RLZZ225_932 [Pseudomonadota bacterium]|jgi:hypothetical protein